MALGLIVLSIGVTLMYLAYSGKSWRDVFAGLSSGSGPNTIPTIPGL